MKFSKSYRMALQRFSTHQDVTDKGLKTLLKPFFPAAMHSPAPARLCSIAFVLIVCCILFATQTSADDETKTTSSKAPEATSEPTKSSEAGSVRHSTGKSPQKPSIATLTAHTAKVEGLWTMYYKDQQLLVDLPSCHLEKNFIVLTSIARGIGSGIVLGGMSWGFNDDVVWFFRKMGNKVHVLRRNVRFRAKPGTPEADAVKLTYNDSVLYSLPIKVKTKEGYLVDMTRIFISDDQQIGRHIGPGFRYVAERSTLDKVKAFPKNVEIQVASVYSGTQPIETVSDSRGVQVHVHYSISMLPENSYSPRKADDRLGYFLTVIKDFSDEADDENFVRYINRWDLKKKDPAAKLSPPEEPIVFYLEKTVPIHLRPYVQAGIEEWNKAFEQMGFSNAVIVLQQGDDDDWDPEDIRYNTFRWITAESGFAMGAPRVNPLTGQILDADIIFDASFLDYWRQDYETFGTREAAALTERTPDANIPRSLHEWADACPSGAGCMLAHGMQQQMGFAAAALTVAGDGHAGQLPEEFTFQALKEIVMHEVGHTLGLRHNFKASSWKSLNDIQAIAPGSTEPTVASVMDYCPANISPEDGNQGLYFTPTIGPYDYWAIEYGYKPISGAEDMELKKIAARGAEAGLLYATDEDARSIDPDPLANAFDLGDDPIIYARQQMDIAASLIPRIVDRTVANGEGYQRARRAFGILLSEYWRAVHLAARVPGGITLYRSHKGDPAGSPPFQLIEASRQREALQLVCDAAFASPTYEPALLNHLAASRWSHWGVPNTTRLDYPIHDVIGTMQAGILSQLLSPLTLTRLQDGELKVPDGDDVYTLAEHVGTCFDALFAEIIKPRPGSYGRRTPCITSFRRNLQRIALTKFANIVLSGTRYPEDARTLSRMYLMRLDAQIATVLGQKDFNLDDYSRAHLVDSQTKIRQVFDAQVQLNSIS